MSNLGRKHVETYLNGLNLLKKTPEWVIEKLAKYDKNSELVADSTYLEGFLKLCKDVSKIDPDAGDWLLNGGFGCCRFTVYGLLCGAFVWGESPQGYDFWSHIEGKLLEGSSGG